MNRPAYDVAVIGGGPGGATAAAILARAGQRVLVLERETFPRFHIGESLLPWGNEVLIQSGAWDKVRAAGFQPKLGAEFTTGNGVAQQRFWFRDGLDALYSQTFQVERSVFDKLLLDHAVDSGAEVRQATPVRAVEFDHDGATVTFAANGAAESARVRWVIDASGRDTFLGRTLNLPKEELPLPKRIAVYAHFEGVTRHPGEAEGHITIVRLVDGWFWIIPMAHGKTSVGMVRSLETFQRLGRDAGRCFEETVQGSTVLRERLQAARRVTEFYTTSDYTYSYGSLAGDRYLLVGDAGTFVDPIFSSGVFIAIKTAADAAKLILQAGDGPLSRRAGERYTREVHRIRNIYLRMIQAFYDNHAFSVFMQPMRHLQLVQSVNAILGGNTRMSFGLRWRVALFHFFCRHQARRRFVRPINFSEGFARKPVTAALS